MSSNNTLRYSDEELSVFKAVIDAKLQQAKDQLSQLQGQIIEGTENASDAHGADWMDDSSLNAEMEMLNNMAIRQRKYIKELENALIRIENKVYGVCIITGDLIDKRRLLAVPITTKSVAAKKNISANKPSPRNSTATHSSSKSQAGKIISKVKSKAADYIDEDRLEEDDDEFLAELEEMEDYPMDQFPDPDDMD
ncbi:MAG: hypothetical protein R2828_16710 [Saprospiraceae bacterium]